MILSIKWNFVRGSFVRSFVGALVSALSFCTALQYELFEILSADFAHALSLKRIDF
jgi:hypothetical protein